VSVVEVQALRGDILVSEFGELLQGLHGQVVARLLLVGPGVGQESQVP
jgi:hypothetical protein